MHRASPVFAALLLSIGCFKADSGLDDEAGGTDTGTDTTETESSDSGDTTTETTTTDDTTTETTTTDDTTTDDATDQSCMGELLMGATCIDDCECASGNCYVIPFLEGQCGQCNADADCPDGGCTAPNPFEPNGSICNMGELGGGCESSEACQNGLVCSNVFSLLDMIEINTCSYCEDDSNCLNSQICAPVISVTDFGGINDCIDPNSLPQDSYCNLEGNGNAACQSGICSTVDLMGLTTVGACGSCNTDADCVAGGTCMPGTFTLDTGVLTGSLCQ